MRILKAKWTKFIALALALATVQVYAHADLLKSASTRLVAAASWQTRQGRLTTRGNNAVTVNGNSARTGETIFPGQTIQTPAGVGATVQLPGLGRVDIAPNTSVTINFEDGKITVALASGCAILSADKGVLGTFQVGESTQHTDQPKGGALDGCAATAPGGAPVVGQGAAASAGAGAGGAGGAAPGAVLASTSPGGLFGLGKAGTIAFFTAAAGISAAAIITPCRRGANPSPTVPRGRNDQCR